MRPRIALAAGIVLLLGLLPAAAAARPQAPGANAPISPALAFWTAERLRAATPRGFVFDADGNAQPYAAPPGRGKPTAAPTSEPTQDPGGGGGGGGGGGTVVTGASWTGGGNVVDGTGKVFFVMGAFLYSCSGTVATDSRAGYSLVLTAGHCVIDKGKFATNWVFIPRYDEISGTSFTDCVSGSTYCWEASGLFVDKAFADQKRFNTTAVLNDFAFAVIPARGADTLEAAAGGSYAITFDGPATGTTLSAFGYPAGAPYDGTDLTYCEGPIGQDANMGNGTWSMACDMTGGSSGGPWFSGDPTTFGGAVLRSLNSYGYSGVDNMYGPKFNSDTQAVYDAANAGSTNTIVVP